MNESPETYRKAVLEGVHVFCCSHNPAHATQPDASSCRIERFMPELIQSAIAVGPNQAGRFQEAVKDTACKSCGGYDEQGVCEQLRDGKCCFSFDLSCTYHAVWRVKNGVPSL